MSELFTFDALLSLITLTVLEIVLGIDNIVFISVISEKVEASKKVITRKLGLGAALVTRIMLLSSLAYLVKMTNPLITLMDKGFSLRDIVLVSGGIFLLWKSTHEIHELTECHDEETIKTRGKLTLASAISQIAVLDIVFSFDSVITAVGMAKHLEIMISAIIIAIIVMLFAVEKISDFINNHQSTKMLAFAMLLMIGVSLIADGFGVHIPRGYIYFAITFSLMVESLNIYTQKKQNIHKK